MEISNSATSTDLTSTVAVFDSLVGDLINVMSSETSLFVDLYSPAIRLKWYTRSLTAEELGAVEHALLARVFKRVSPQLVDRVHNCYYESDASFGGVAEEVERLTTMLLSALRLAESHDKFGVVHKFIRENNSPEALVQDVQQELLNSQQVHESGAFVSLSIAGRDAIAYLGVGALTQREFRAFTLRDFRFALDPAPFFYLSKFNRCTASLLLA